MTSYDSIPQKQILSYQVRGPETEAITYVMLQHRTLSLDSLIEKFVPSEGGMQVHKTDLLREALNFLRTVEFIRQVSDDDQNVTYYLADDLAARESFPLKLLRRLQGFDDDRRAFRLVTDLIASRNLLFAHRKDIVTALEVAYPGSYSWNVEKVQTWAHLANFLGLVRSVKPEQGDIMFCPRPILLLDLLMAYCKDRGSTERIPIGEWLSSVHETYFSCFTDRKEVHIGLARSLKAMNAAGRLRVDMYSDAPSTVNLDGQPVAYLTHPANLTAEATT
jgi:hypothetical protein